jgi:methylenetetrahydrofolate dehydrogenase (NADP+) / methenyltetrahydrofolate cyclohydrolase
MTATIIDGKAIAADLRAQVAARVADINARHRLSPGLAVVLVGNDPASEIYVRNKAKASAEIGMRSFEHRLPATTSATELLALLSRLNADEAVDGILVQLPLPPQIDPALVLDAIDPDKDVDGFHVVNAGRLATGRPALVPDTPVGCEILLRHVRPEIEGEHAVIVGRSNIVGRPLAQLLLKANCTVTIAHSKTRDLPELCRTGSILVVAVGRAELVRGHWIRPGAVVIDVGINRVPAENGKTRVVGDVAFAEAVQVAGAITPVPGGVGPMTIACLLRNTVIAACRRRGIEPEEF